jgi:SAM-dependent methyltransferase
MDSGDTSWESSSAWYDKIVGAKGHYFHQQVILPNLLRLLELEKTPKASLLDLACGQGILARHLPKGVKYLGIDSSASLIQSAKKYPLPQHRYVVHDLSHPIDLPDRDFSHAACILAVQNLAHPGSLFQTASAHLSKNAPFIIVLNHPCFRIPRQSSWGIDEQKKLQYRRIDRYKSPLKIPIQTQPSKQGASEETWSFHQPLSCYSAQLKQAGFAIDLIEEWCSDKKSAGKTAAMENRSRLEFPLFMAIVAIKI